MLSVDCNEWLGASLSWTNRKARSPVLHIAKVNQLKLQKIVARWKWEFWLRMRKCVGVLWSGSWEGLFSEPPIGADVGSGWKINLRDVGSVTDLHNGR